MIQLLILSSLTALGASRSGFFYARNRNPYTLESYRDSHFSPPPFLLIPTDLLKVGSAARLLRYVGLPGFPSTFRIS